MSTVPSGSSQNAVQRQANPEAEDPRPERSVAPVKDIARLTEAELHQLQELKARDREVRAHEQAHIAAGGALVRGGAQYSYQLGPDGRRYAVGGEVSIGTANVPGDPEKTARNAEQIQRAALAPANPSAQDRAVAAQAAATAASARSEAAAQQREQALESQPNAKLSSDSDIDSATASTAENVARRGAEQARSIAAYESVAALGEEQSAAVGKHEHRR